MHYARIYPVSGSSFDIYTAMYKTRSGLDRAVNKLIRENRDGKVIVEVYEDGKQKLFEMR